MTLELLISIGFKIHIYFTLKRNFYLTNGQKLISSSGVLELKLNRTMNGNSLICEHSNTIGHSVLNQRLNISCNAFNSDFVY